MAKTVMWHEIEVTTDWYDDPVWTFQRGINRIIVMRLTGLHDTFYYVTGCGAEKQHRKLEPALRRAARKLMKLEAK